MKKRTALLIILAMLFSFCAAQADTDKEIRFAGHSFGEQMELSLREAKPARITFDSEPMTSRVLVDPAFSFLLFDPCPIPITYAVTLGQREIGGYTATVTHRYYYTCEEDSRAMNFKNGIFYAGYYEFPYLYQKAEVNSIFNDLKGYLTELYGKPSAEGRDGEKIWGKHVHADSVSEDEWAQGKGRTTGTRGKVNYVVWDSSANNAMIVLQSTMDGRVVLEGRTGNEVLLYYIDKSADEKILALYEANREDPKVNSMNGL